MSSNNGSNVNVISPGILPCKKNDLNDINSCSGTATWYQWILPISELCSWLVPRGIGGPLHLVFQPFPGEGLKVREPRNSGSRRLSCAKLHLEALLAAGSVSR